MRFGRAPPPEVLSVEWWWSAPAVQIEALRGLSRLNLAGFCALVLLLLLVRRVSLRMGAAALKCGQERTLNLSELNRVVTMKEVFLAYLNAGILEPLLVLAEGRSNISGKAAVVNVLQLFGLCWWIYLLSDVFDTSDVAQAYTYERKLVKDPPAWLQSGGAAGRRRRRDGERVMAD